ncbi:methionine gamma-lyase [Leeia aquatica]|uniref:L-methionine gamma-lyase n=1 Tax=Leeia aquatica TaxID=2725557 RepID=A0A847S3S5_9NEIS|nr:methionine gamma-lyase [Leeia aquatica]NLR73817.1 methionine gamma-lyase [Leeia aquatica]
MTTPKTAGFATRAIHHGYNPADHQGALVPPVYMTSTFAFPTAEYGGQCFAGEAPGYIYTRIANPTLNLLEQRLAVLEGGEAAVAFASGMGAVTATLWSLLQPGDEIIVDETLYGCTYAFLHHGIGRFGVQVRHIDLTRPELLKEAMGPHTRMVYFETPANPNMRMVDIAAISQIAHDGQALVVVDNTYCSPYLQQPLQLGADVSLHSATKYLGGHGDLTAGIVICNAELAQRIRLVGLKDMTGAVMSPQDAYLILRGLKTLALRMERHCDNAEKMAALLAAHPAVEQVYYPGLPGFPQRELAARQMRRAGGMIAFELKGGEAAGRRFINALQMVTCAVSLGDAETLAQHPASMTHSTYTPEERAQHFISEGLIRLSAGLEDAEDILADLEQALDQLR